MMPRLICIETPFALSVREKDGRRGSLPWSGRSSLQGREPRRPSFFWTPRSYASSEPVPAEGTTSPPAQAWKLADVKLVPSSVFSVVAILAKVCVPDASTRQNVPSCGKVASLVAWKMQNVRGLRYEPIGTTDPPL